MLMSRKLVSWLKARREDSLVLAHADHDGQCASSVFSKVFGTRSLNFFKSFNPPFFFPTKSTGLIINFDLLFSRGQISHYLSRGIRFANLDHHKIIDLNHPDYLCLNPKSLWGKQYISSSALLWHLFKRRVKKYAWALVIGDCGDLCVNDSPELYKYVSRKWPELVPSVVHDVLYSKAYDCANALYEAMRVDRVSYSYNLLLRALDEENPSVVYNDVFLNKLVQRRKKLCEAFYYRNYSKFYYSDRAPLVVIDSSKLLAGAFSLWLNLKERTGKVYVDYSEGRVYFRSLFGKVAVNEIAGLYCGGGNNPRVGSGKTPLNFREFCMDYESNLLKRIEQRKISDF